MIFETQGRKVGLRKIESTFAVSSKFVGVMEWWSDGVMEKWAFKNILSILQYSNFHHNVLSFSP